MVQVRWGHINREYSLLTQVESVILDGHFMIEHGGRHLSGRFFNFNGTAGIWRRAAIETAGGWEHDTLTEDTDLSYRAQMAGWKFLYLPHIVCPAELPVEMNSFKTQQSRWAKGLIQTAIKLLPRILRSDLPWKIKIEAFFHLTANISYPLMIVLVVPAAAGDDRAVQSGLVPDALHRPAALAGVDGVGLDVLSDLAAGAVSGLATPLKYLPFLMSVGIGLSVSNSKAVMEALLGIKISFKRTPKYRIESKTGSLGHEEVSAPHRRHAAVRVVLGVYFALVVLYAFMQPELSDDSVSDALCHRIHVHGTDVDSAHDAASMAERTLSKRFCISCCLARCALVRCLRIEKEPLPGIPSTPGSPRRADQGERPGSARRSGAGAGRISAGTTISTT